MAGMRARPLTRLLFLLLLILVLLGVPACNRKFRLQTLSPESIPAELRGGEPAEGMADFVWRDFHEEQGYFVAASTWRFTTPTGRDVGVCYGVGFYTLDADGTLKSEGLSGSALPLEWFQGGGGRGQASSHAGGTYSFRATGIALHRQAVKVIGTTTTGRIVEGKVSNGFWGLLVPDGEYDEWWTSVNALDAGGKVLFRFYEDERWQIGY
jgi:hypothetical protein